MKTRLRKKLRLGYFQSFVKGIPKAQMISLLLLLMVFLSACGRPGMYSVVVKNPGVQSEQNDLNDLSNPYKKKKLVYPKSIVIMSDEERHRWLDTLNQYAVHKVDTSVKVGMLNTPGLVFLDIPACAKKGVAVVMLDDVKTRKRGKWIDVEMRYVCKADNPGVEWRSLDKFWAATATYKIDVNDNCNDCYDGFQSVEFQFIPQGNDPTLRSVLIICADE